MTILYIVLLVLGISLLLLLGLLSMIRNLGEFDSQGEPVFDETAPICNEEAAEQRETRPQFSWQSRSHFRAPD